MNEKDFSQKLRPWLDRSAENIGELQATRLRAARLRALDAYRQPRWLAILPSGLAARAAAHPAAFRVLVLALPLVVVAGVLGTRALQPAPDVGELDAQILASDVPLETLLDKDFGEWLKNASRP